MMGKRKARRKKGTWPGHPGGFEFGFVQRVLYANTSSIDFNNLMIEARVNGCAYGYERIAGYPGEIPTLTLVGEKADKLRAASDILKDWGCDIDGDAVDVTVLLRNDGKYLLGMQPNFRRMSDRMVKDRALFDLIFSGVTWIKTLDSSHPILREWKHYRKSKLSPVQIMFATAEAKNGVPQIDTVKVVPGAISFVKLELEIKTETEAPDHWFLEIADRRKRSRHGRPHDATPPEVARARKGVIDGVFPVSRNRIRRAGIYDRVLTLCPDDPPTRAQVEQAAINVQLSREWSDGADHYPASVNVEKTWWDLVGKRVEICGSPDPFPGMDASIVVRQIELDVEVVLRRHGATVSPKFRTNQRTFLRLGYGGR